jgi:hypothetical protein
MPNDDSASQACLQVSQLKAHLASIGQCLLGLPELEAQESAPEEDEILRELISNPLQKCVFVTCMGSPTRLQFSLKFPGVSKGSPEESKVGFCLAFLKRGTDVLSTGASLASQLQVIQLPQGRPSLGPKGTKEESFENLYDLTHCILSPYFDSLLPSPASGTAGSALENTSGSADNTSSFSESSSLKLGGFAFHVFS